MTRSFVFHHDFLVCFRYFYAKQLTFRTVFYDVGGRLLLIEFMHCCRDSLSAYFTLPLLFIIIQFLCLTHHCFVLPSFSANGVSAPSASASFSCNDQPPCDRVLRYGGGRQHEFSALEVKPYISAAANFCYDSAFKFVDHVDRDSLQHAYPIVENYIHTNIPLRDVVPHLSVRAALKLARLHNLQIGSHVPKSAICRIFEAHKCIDCNIYLTVFSVVHSKAARRRTHKAEKQSESGDIICHAKCRTHEGVKLTEKEVPPLSHSDRSAKTTSQEKKKSNVVNLKPRIENRREAIFSEVPDTTPFPPAPVDSELTQKIINDFCRDSSPSAMEEAGCAVCGQLVPVSRLTRLKGVKNLLHILHASSVTRFERMNEAQSIREYKGPVLDHACNQICNDCRQHGVLYCAPHIPRGSSQNPRGIQAE